MSLALESLAERTEHAWRCEETVNQHDELALAGGHDGAYVTVKERRLASEGEGFAAEGSEALGGVTERAEGVQFLMIK
jgi:hypothetical protein